MRLVRVGTAAVSVKVGDFEGNAARIGEAIAAAKEQGVHMLVTPELGISGYSLEDRVWWGDIARRSWAALLKLAPATHGLAVFAGLPVRYEAMMYNALALLYDGEVRGLILKRVLPTYSIFYEARNWTPWTGGVTEINGAPAGDLVFDLPFGKVSAEICEDMWSSSSPARQRVLAGAELICNGSASPFTPLKNDKRRQLIEGAAGSMACVYAYANILGCDNSRLVFDGGGFVATPDGVVAEGPLLSKDYWTLATGVVDLDDIARVRAENTTWRQASGRREAREATRIVKVEGVFTPTPVCEYAESLPGSFFLPDKAPQRDLVAAYLDELFDALTLGLRDYFEKVGAFDRFLVALSGGRDSSLCLLLAHYACKHLAGGSEGRIWTAYLPNRQISSSETEQAARALAEELGAPFQVCAIEDESRLALEKAEELMDGRGDVTPMAKQNLQARIRGGMMLNWSNSAKALVLVTSNLSEAAVGYTTTGGDNQGGYSPIANVPKTLVTRLLDHIAQRDGIEALRDILAIPPSAELEPDQEDEADLMPYAVLDDLLYLFARRRHSLPDCWRLLVCRHSDHPPEVLRQWTADFGRLFAHNQWKREQLPVAMKVMDLDLDPKTGFRFPVTQSIQAELDELETADLEG